MRKVSGGIYIDDIKVDGNINKSEIMAELVSESELPFIIAGQKFFGMKCKVTVEVDGKPDDFYVSEPDSLRIEVYGDCVEVNSVNGDVTVSGNVEGVDTINGNVTVGKNATEIGSVNGDILIKGKVHGKVHTMNGNIEAGYIGHATAPDITHEVPYYGE